MVKENLGWTKQFVNMTAAQRKAVKERVLAQIKDGLGKTRKNPLKKKGNLNKQSWSEPKEEKTEEKPKEKNYGEQLYDLLSSPDIVFIGVVPNTRYFKCSGSRDELEALWIHPHGSPALLFGHKKGGILFTVSPMLRINDSVINEIPGNIKTSMTGIAG